MKKFRVLILGIILFVLSVEGIKAETISYKRLDNIYFNLTVDGRTTSNHVTMFYLDDRLAYCIEPGKDITTKVYNALPNWNGTNLSLETQKYIEKIGYYGYEYPNHQTPKYYIATQELIWRAIKNVDIYFTTQKDGRGDIIDLSAEKREILSLVEKHDVIPSFTNTTIEGKVSETLTVFDDNNVLENFNISESKYHQIVKKDNQLDITFNKEVKEEELTLSRNNYDNLTLLVYHMQDSQKLAALRFSIKEDYKFQLKSVEKPKEIVKVPSTSISKSSVQFGVLKFYQNDSSHFN